MVRISDTGQAELDSYMATNGPVLPKGSGYGPLDTGPAVRAAPRTNVPNYTNTPTLDLPTFTAPSAAPSNFLPASWQYEGPGQAIWDDVSSFSGPPTPFSLDFESQGYQSPIVAPPPTFQQPFVNDPWGESDGGSFLGGLGSALGDFGRGALDLGQQVWDIQRQRQALEPSMYGGGSGDPYSQPLTPSRVLQYSEPLYSGNAFIEGATLGTVDREQLEGLPYNLGYVTDAINPLGIAAVAGGPSVPIIGSTLGGGLAKRAAGEIAIDIASRVGAEQAAGDFGESIPYFGELEPWQRGLIGGLAGGVTAAGGIKAIDDVDFGAAGRSLAESNPFAAPQPGTFDLPRGAIDPTTGRPFEWQAPMGGARTFDEEIAELNRIIGEQWGTPAAADAQRRLDALILADKGKPVVLFHGSDAPGLTSISPKGRTAYGAFFTPDEDVAGYYGRNLYAVNATDSGMLDLRPEWSFRAFAREALGLDGDELEDAVRWHEEGTLYNSFGSRGLQDDVVRTAESLGFKGVIFNDATSQFGVNPSYVFTKEVTVGSGLSGGADEAISPLSPDAPQVMNARRSLLDALDAETKLRTSGVVEAEISAGRGTQAAGIRTGLQGLSSEATLDDALQAARQGASTGPLRQTTAGPLNITPDVQTQLVRDILDNPNLREFDTLRALKALDKLTQGEGLQPNEIKLLGRVFGSEVEQAAIRANAGRIPTVATLTEADLAEVARRAEVDGRGVARLEVEAMRQSELADNLLKQSRMDPTNKRLAKAADDARARAIAKANEADRRLAQSIDRANRLAEQKQARSAATEAQKATRAEARAAEARDIKNPNYEQLVKRAEDALDKADISPELKAQQLESVRVWLKANEAILDAYGDNAPGMLRAAYAAVTGDVTDSWTSTLLTREAILKSALEAQGMSPNMAKLVARRLRDAEVARRFGQTVPEYVTKSLDEAKGLPYGAEGSIGGLASISQELKNTQFGIGDLAVFGQQGLKAGTTNAPQILAGIVNRTLAALHLPHWDTQLADTALAKRLMYQLDGVAQSSHAVTDLTAEATLFSRLGRPGAWLDRKAVIPFTRMLTDFQFNTVLTSIRNVAYEGNLVLAKMAGADISDPIVRARAAEWANAATGAGKLAQRTARAQTEKAFLLSPSMRRAQIQQIGQVARGLSSGSRVDRILAAATIASAVGSTVAVWKLLNDWIGQDDFEWDPSKPGFGNITLPGGTVINLFPQEQVAKALARSLRALVEDGITEADLKEIGKVWGNLGIGSASPGVRPMLAALGVGYDPETGYEYGGLGDGTSFAERLLKNAPIPPLGMSLISEGFDPVRTSFEAIGVNAYEESEWQQREKRIKADPRFNGRGWSELEEWEKNLINSEQGRVYHSDPQIKAQQERADVIAGDARDYQEKIDGWLRAGQKPDGTPYTVDDWKQDRAKNDRYVAGRYDELYRDVDFKDTNITPVDRYYAAIADRVNPETDEVDWDRVEAWLKGQSWEDQAYISRNTNLRDTDMEKEYRADVKKIAASGYFDLEEGKMQFRQENPEIAELVRKWGYSKLSVAAEDQINQYRSQQEMDDQALEAGTMDPEKWRENRKTRQAQLSAAKDAIYAGLREDGESTEALDQYFATIEANKPNGIDVDWDAVDAWVASQPPEVQQTIDSYAGTALTPKVQEYRDAVAKIEASQYWDINDRVAQRVVEAQGGTWEEGMTADRYYGQIEAAVYQRLQERGFSELEAQSLTGVVMQDVMGDYLDIAGKVRGAMREADPELMRLLIAWGYYTPGKETTAELVASGGLR